MPLNVADHPFVIRPEPDLLQQRPYLRHAAHGLASKYASREPVTKAELQGLGQQLWQAVDQDAPFEQARQQAGARILPLVIESASPAIQALPWEVLYHPKLGFLGKAAGCTLSRCLPGTAAEPPPLESGPLRVLLFTSLPDDLEAETARLDVEEEQAQVQEALAPWIAQGLVELEMPDDGRLASLKEYLHRFQPHLLFLSGHGKFHRLPHTGEAPYGVFLFESESGSSQSVRDAEIIPAFAGSRVQLVVLLACELGQADSTALNNGLTRQLSGLGIPHVIGMRESLLDRAGILFARRLCDALAGRERVDVALQLARQAITTPLKGSPRLDDDAGPLAELSLGQWCLPMLLSPQAGRPLIDRQFSPRRPEPRLTNQSLSSISLPPRFVGRRAELRQLQSRLRRGELRRLLITGPGGQGKTALAGRLAQDLQRRGYEILAWSARPENSWREFLFELELQLSPDHAQRYDRLAARFSGEGERAGLLLRLLLSQSGGRLVLFFDNLESLQQPESLALNDERIQAWLEAAGALAGQGLILLLTSRWRLPGWPEAEHWPLGHASYGDFLQMAQQQGLPPAFFNDRSRLRWLYTTLHGNGRGLEFFAAASHGMNQAEEEAFLARLAQAEAELQTNMALARIIGQLGPAERDLLQRLPAYTAPVPREGIVKLALDLPQDGERLLERLLVVSLVEQQYDPAWQSYQYQLSPLVTAWLAGQGTAAPGPDLLRAAAAYQHYLFRRERRTLSQAVITHQALGAAGQKAEADRFALDIIVGPLNRRGWFRTLLNEWLPDICQSPDPAIRAEALGQSGKQHHHLGDYETALSYLKQSLAISQEIGDRAGFCYTLFNMGHIHWQNEEVPQAVQAWVTVYRLASAIHLAEVLNALETLARQLGLQGGLAGWERLVQQMEEEG
jgi:tetratricopeptide (TPR) repeat protein